ncbi:hypothetical protein DL96DRAFT_1244534 [Flagelloscypha sp. PMI_526]|nr:hypothetical protein DL96DRAFT_1244534 [Flagelloscypha sp. PMI_526]
MLFATLATLLTFLLVPTLATPSVQVQQLIARIRAEDCYGAVHQAGMHSEAGYSAAAVALLYKCQKEIEAKGWSNNVYSVPSCVAAYTMQYPYIVGTTLACAHPETDFNRTSAPHLNFNIYAQIVGDCAWNQPEACPITQQNYIDFIYGQIQQTENPSWPSSVDQVITMFKYILTWTATGSTTPYHNFDDFLHYA